MAINRHRGYVAGKANPPAKPNWLVRVKDPGSEYNGRRFVVASTHDSFELAQGLNVDFLIGSIDGERGVSVLRAVDVSLSTVINPQQGDRNAKQ